jgi:predicted enzyme related to lactoylglutathione lyase
MTAEKVARQVWHKLPKKDFKASIKFEGQILAETLLDRAQLEYMWILRFWERCKVAGW